MSIILYPRLPDFFVTPDLGPKMYNAYGKYVLHNSSSIIQLVNNGTTY
jgi:hypothetical protein